MEVIPVVIAPADSSLVCHHNDPNSQRITTTNCGCGAFNQVQVFDTVKVMRIRDDDAISIEK
jgi:hypothetical protein